MVIDVIRRWWFFGWLLDTLIAGLFYRRIHRVWQVLDVYGVYFAASVAHVCTLSRIELRSGITDRLIHSLTFGPFSNSLACYKVV